MAAAIEVKHVSKRFKITHERYTSLKEKVIHYGRIPYEEFWALNDVDFEVEAGTTVGLLGHNGSGKSTLLKCMAGILQPTEGEIVTRGRLAALLELGTGFHGELTGRENVYMNASILGLSKKDVDKVFDEIVAFAEIERFIDMQVRQYSSGMFVRLAFALAVNIDPDILLVDEVLAVGDEAFQRKCLERVKKFQREGRTILVVTHAADMVRQVCDRAVVLDHGLVISDSTPGEAVRTFRESLQKPDMVDVDDEYGDDRPQGTARESIATHRIRITDVSVVHPGSDAGRHWLLPGEPLSIRVQYHAAEDTSDIQFGVAIYDQKGDHLFGTNTTMLGIEVDAEAGDGEVSFDFAQVPLLDGTYLITLAIQSADEGTVYDWSEQRQHFEVMNPSSAWGLVAVDTDVRFADPKMVRAGETLSELPSARVAADGAGASMSATRRASATARDAGVSADAFFQLAYGRLPGFEVRKQLDEMFPSGVIASAADAHRLIGSFNAFTNVSPFQVRALEANLLRMQLEGFALWIDRSDSAVSEEIEANGVWEPHVAHALGEALFPGATFVDVGANIGYHTFRGASLVGPEGHVIAVEAYAENCRLLQLSKFDSHADNVEIVAAALDRTRGMGYLSTSLGSNAALVAGTRADFLAGRAVVTYATTLDDIAPPHVDVMKIDVEGAEFRVIEGGRKTIERDKPVIVMEFSREMASRVSEVDPESALQDVLDIGYSLRLLDRRSTESFAYDSAHDLLDGWANMGRIEDLLLVPR